MDLETLGRLVIAFGVFVVVVGLALFALGRGFSWHLPGDLALRFGNVRVFLPFASSIVLSIIATIVLNVIARR